MQAAPALFSYRKFWAHRFGVASQLPMSREEMDVLGWDSCDIIIVTGDAYVDHPSFGMAIIGRLLESQGFRVGIISQPDWNSADDFKQLGQPNLFFGVTGGNMDSMVNRYTSDRRMRSNDAYTAAGEGGKRPDRCVVPYSQRCREAYKGVPIIIGGIEASLRRIAHFDYWSEKVRRSVIMDAKADILVYGNGERQIVEIAHRLSRKEDIKAITDIRGTAVIFKHGHRDGWWEKDSSSVDTPGKLNPPMDPYQMKTAETCDESKPKDTLDDGAQVIRFKRAEVNDKEHTVVRLPAYQSVREDKVLYAHTSRILHLETNPGNAFALVQQHGERDVWLNPPPIPLTTEEMDGVFDLPYSRVPHKQYGDKNIPAYEMIRFSVNIMRGCFGGCTFCSITEHEGRIIQSRSEDSIIKEIEAIRDTTPGFTGVISDLGGPTANMYRLACNDKKIEASCRRLSCVYPSICKNLGTDHTPLIKLYKRARALPGVKKVLIASGLRYDLAVLSPEYVKELVTHHVGGYLKIAPEHTEDGPLDQMMKPGIGTYDAFKKMFDQFSKEAGKEQYLIPYFIAAHPGTTDKDMLNLAIWLKRNGFRADQVQAYLPSPMSAAAAMYHSGKNTLRKVKRRGGDIAVPKGIKVRRLHKAFLRYHDPENWPMLRDALNKMGRADLIGNGKKHLIPTWQPAGTGEQGEGKRFSSNRTATKSASNVKSFRTQHVRSTEIGTRAKVKPVKKRRR
ncbi:MAG: YgiQ family radical SAM protein [Piscirickettsiaceae bacterium]|nr:YgiQ family radical SAM protein [Piscirickettsiaceae bacterium]